MKVKMIYKLDNTLQEYAWGSKTAFTEILGIENPDDLPMAELWMGAHTLAPSNTSEGALDLLVSSNPEALLGRKSSEKFERRLPFLFKVLAAGAPLSIQAHPSLVQAGEGFARENDHKIPLSAFNRNYKDDNHKPEILCALTPFTAMWGFRPADEIRKEFSILEGRAVPSLLTALDSDDETAALKMFFQTLMTLPEQSRNELIESARQNCSGKQDLKSRWLMEFYRLYPGDPGILSALYLNILTLEPGEAVFIPAGELHAYLDGTGMELMANSDNVLRGGLTPKNVDIPELMSVLTFSSRKPVKVQAESIGPVTHYPVPAEEFLLSRIDIGAEGITRKLTSCEIFICLEGEIRCSVNDPAGVEPPEIETFSRGDSFFVPAAAEGCILSGRGTVYSAGIPV